jgi:hypothetical protein
MLIVSDIYAQLHLPIAAKQYALAAAVAARSSTQTKLAGFLPRGLSLAASYDYQAGNWLTATHTFRVATTTQGNFAHDPWNLSRHDEFSTMVSYQAMILKTARDLRPGLAAHIEEQLEPTGMIDMIEAILDGVDQPGHSEETWACIADTDGGGRPFSDAGSTRRYQWTALGMSWTVTAGNDRLSVLACERFVAAAQIVHAELATDDALLLGGQIQVELRADAHELPDGRKLCEPVPDNHATRWIVHLTPLDRLDEQEEALHEVTVALVHLMATHSLLPYDKFRQVMGRTFDRGLWHKLASGRPYDELADLVQSEVYDAIANLAANPMGPDVPVRQKATRELEASTAPGPGYTREDALALIRTRYKNLAPVVRLTVPRLAADDGFMAIARRLRDEGWRDWHLLTAIANHVANKRFAWEGLRLDRPTLDTRQRVMALAHRPERHKDPQVPVGEFTEKTMRFALRTAALSTLRGLDLDYRRDTPDFGAIFDFLGRRYGYWSDDVEHADFFGWST